MVHPRTTAEGKGSALPRLQAALDYAQQGLRVLPLHTIVQGGKCSCGNEACASPGKHPLTPHGVKDASCEEKVVRNWWQRWAFANVGIATGGGLVVIDIDPRHGGTLEALEEFVDTSDGTLVETGSGGWHLYFLYDSSISLRNTTGQLGEGIDTRAADGYVVAPPSIHQAGGTYRWIRGLDEIYALPDEALARLQKPARQSAHAHTVAPVQTENAPGKGGRVQKGRRNSEVFRWVCHLRRMDGSEQAILDMALAYNKSTCEPPLDEDEVRKIVAGTRAKQEGSQREDKLRKVLSSDEVGKRERRPKQWAIPGLLPSGLVLLVAKPKKGKSWLGLQMALAVASGGEVLGFQVPAPQKVLYLDLEEDVDDYAIRMDMLLGHPNFPGTLKWTSDWYRQDEGGLEDLERWMLENPDTKLIVLDVLVKFLPVTASQSSAFVAEYNVIKALQEFAQKHRISFLVLHHSRKAAANDATDEINGTTGMSAGTEGLLYLYRADRAYVGELTALTPLQAAGMLKKDRKALGQLMGRMVDDKQLVRIKGKYGKYALPLVVQQPTLEEALEGK